MNHHETAILVLFVAFYLLTFALYHLMIFRVNQHLTPDQRLRHSISVLTWQRLRQNYNAF
jgi:hypothetical protein